MPERLKYFLETRKIDNGPGYWNSLEVSVMRQRKPGPPEKIRQYTRNYSTMFNTFYPFTRHGKDYALYSLHYTGTRVMSLQSGKDIAGEDPAPEGDGFCPVDFYVPDDKIENPDFGFVSGCYWGDDTSWKVQYLDISRIEQGILKRDDRFGYHELPYDVNLKDAVNIIPGQDKLIDSIYIARLMFKGDESEVDNEEEPDYYTENIKFRGNGRWFDNVEEFDGRTDQWIKPKTYETSS